MSSPFFAVDPRWWPSIADGLAKPWSPDAVKADLRWWEDQVWAGLKKRIPGRPTLRGRWGWTDHQVRGMLQEEAQWRDPTCKVSPADRQRVASESPAGRQESRRKPAESQDHTASESPAARQPVASKTPQARSTQHTTHSTHHKDNKGERDGPNLSTDSDPLARMAAVAWRKHYTEIMGFDYKPDRRKWKQMIPHFREMAQVAGCDRESTVDTIEGHRLNGAIQHYITAAKARAIWPHKTGDAAPCPRVMRQHHLADSLAAAPPMRCKCCKGTKRRTGAYLVSTEDAVDLHEFPCPECDAAGLAELVATLEGMGRREGETYWTHGILPHEPQHAAYVALVQTTLRGEA